MNYSDILSHTLSRNKEYFDITVITTPEDKKTQRLCEIYGVRCLKTNAFYDGDFNKGKAINEAIQTLCLTPDTWVLHLDADIWLHPQAIQSLYSLKLNPLNLYGVDRIMIESFREWSNFVSMPDVYEGNWLLNLSRFKVGSRITQYWSGQNWQVLGFFQLWNPFWSNIYHYPSSNDSSQSDIVFSSLFKRENRILLPEVMAVHLENGESQTGKNWKGRKVLNFF